MIINANVPSNTHLTLWFLQNSAAQYWIAGSGSVEASCIVQLLDIFETFKYSGSFTRNLMKPGTYGVTLYQGEIAAGSGTVTVSAGKTSSITLTTTLSKPSVIWSIGTLGSISGGIIRFLTFGFHI